MIDLKFTQFFDRPGVISRVKDGTKSVLSRAGAFIRTRAQSSLRRRKRSAEPGSPPSDHGGWLRRLIFFAFDSSTESVVVGPALFRSQKPPAPLLLEEGGTINHFWRTGKPATYRKFPYMKPALEAEQPKFPDLFTNSIK